MNTIGKILFFSFMLLIALLSLLPQALGAKEMSDKLLHGSAYAVLGFLGVMAFVKKMRIGEIALVVCICILFGGVIEVLQSYTGRSMDIFDFYADVIGSITGMGLGIALYYLKKKILAKLPSNQT